MKKNRKFYFLVLIFIVSLAIMITVRQLQNDTFYTIKVGEQIFKTGIDMKDHFSWINGLSYTYPHWLYDVLIYIIYYLFGFKGIYIFTIVFTSLLLFTMYITTNNIIKDRGLSLSLTILLGFTLKDFITARAQLISYILFLLILFFIEKLEENGNKKYTICILLCSILIANFHTATWMFVLVLFMPYLIADLIGFIKGKNLKNIKKYQEKNKLTDNRIEVEKGKYTKNIIITFILTIFTGFLTPHSPLSFTYFLKTKMGISMSYISEHLPTTIKIRPELFIILVIIVFLLLQSNMKIKLKDLFLIGGLSLLALLSKRSYALFAILSIFSFARILKLFIDKRMKDVTLENVLLNKYIMVIMILLFVISGAVKLKYESKKDYVNEAKYPVDLSTYIINNLDINNIRIYNEYNFGSYLLFRDILVFIDSRADLYTEEFNEGCTIFKAGVVNIFKRYKFIFDKYDVTHVVIYNTNKLKSVLDIDSNYKRIYVDDYFTMYEKLT